MPSNLTLTKFCILDKDARKAKFAFKLDHYNTLVKHQMSRSFNFGGNYWKFQVSKTNDHLGMYLRWYGTARPFDRHTVKCTCTAATRFSVVNHFFPDNSVSEGISKTADTFEKLGCGIGYSRVILISELEKSPGYLLNDTLYLQLFLNVVQTTFHSEVSGNCKPGMEFVEGLRFLFYGSTWYVLLYPDGEETRKGDRKAKIENNNNNNNNNISDNNNNNSKSNKDNDRIVKREGTTDMDGSKHKELKHDNDKIKYAGVYLRRDTDHLRRSLRHNVQFIISIDGAGECVLDQHFYNANSNVYGSATFMPVSSLQKIIKSGKVSISIKFMTIVPYMYYSYGVNRRENTLSDGFLFNDHYKYPWKFKLSKNPSENKDNLQGVMKLDPIRGSKRVKNIPKRGSALQVCWFVEILCPENILKSLTFMSRGKRPVIDSFFNSSGEKDAINFHESADQVCDDASPLMDADGNLCVLVSVLCANLVNKKGSEGSNILDVSICDDLRSFSLATTNKE